jgi:ADP-ribose pyrophosphatase YjhB (NUDIX family)
VGAWAEGSEKAPVCVGVGADGGTDASFRWTRPHTVCIVNVPPDHCPHCGDVLDPVEPPTVHRCPACEAYVFFNPTASGGVAVLDGDAVLLVEDFREAGTWTLPEGRFEVGERPRDGAARELREETGLSVDPDALVYWTETTGEPVPDQHMLSVDYAVERAATTGEPRAGSDATDARFVTPDEFAASEAVLRDSAVDRFGTDDLAALVASARAAVDRAAASGHGLGREHVAGEESEATDPTSVDGTDAAAADDEGGDGDGG